MLSSAWPRAGLRAHLVGLVLVALLPALAIGGLAAWQLAEGQREASAERLTSTARALARALDEDLDTHLVVARLLAASPELLPGGDLAAFHAQASDAAIAMRGPWSLTTQVIVYGQPPDYRQLVNTAVLPGHPLPSGPGQPLSSTALSVVFSTGQVLVSDVDHAKPEGEAKAVVLAPVLRDGAVMHAVAVVFEPARISRLLAGYPLQDGAFAVVTDSLHRTIAHAGPDDRLTATEMPEWFTDGIAGRSGGMLRGQMPDGSDAVLAFEKSQRSGWTVAIAMPAAAYVMSWRGPLLLLGGGGLILLVASGLLAAKLARRILRPVKALVSAAADIARPGGSAAAAPGFISPAPIVEIEALRRAMLHAALTLEERAKEARRGAARQRLLAAELSHRVKNALAVVQAIAQLTLTRSTSLAEFRVAFEGRLQALSRAHGLLLRRHWDAVALREVVAQELAVYHPEPGAVLPLSGPEVLLTPKQGVALGMVVHEMATNSAKYGALAGAGGRLAVEWRLRRGERPPRLHLRWIEEGIVSADDREGFGSRLIRQLSRHELNGEARRETTTDGLVWHIDFPLALAGAALDVSEEVRA